MSFWGRKLAEALLHRVHSSIVSLLLRATRGDVALAMDGRKYRTFKACDLFAPATGTISRDNEVEEGVSRRGFVKAAIRTQGLSHGLRTLAVKSKITVSINAAFRAVWTLTKKEFLDNVRNRWILALSAVFVLLILAVSYFGAAQTGGSAGFRGLPDTVAGMAVIEFILVPMLGLMISYGAVVGEKHRGSILLLLSMPITRPETILGKFLGLGAVMLAAILSGLGIGGGVIMVFAGTEGWESFLVFLLGSALFALAFLSIGLFLSSLTKRRGTAMGLAVFLWFFFAFIFNLVLIGIFVATGGTFTFQTPPPDWWYPVSLANPQQAFNFFVLRAFGITEPLGLGVPVQIPAYLTVGTTALVLAVWALVPIGLSIWRFRGQDL